jgi:hypothetical protein
MTPLCLPLPPDLGDRLFIGSAMVVRRRKGQEIHCLLFLWERLREPQGIPGPFSFVRLQILQPRHRNRSAPFLLPQPEKPGGTSRATVRSSLEQTEGKR